MSDSPTLKLKIVSYNIHGGKGIDGRRDPARIAAIINALDADIVALQEVASKPGQADLSQLRFLAEATGLKAVPGPTLLRLDAPCGTGLLLRHPIHISRHVDLSFPGREPRGAVDVDLKIGERVIQVVCTHLGLRTAERRTQIDMLLAELTDHRSDVLIVAGDINEWWPCSRNLRTLQERLGKLPAPATFPAVLPLLALDRIWITPINASSIKLTTYTTSRTRLASDHLPVVAEVELKSTNRANTA